MECDGFQVFLSFIPESNIAELILSCTVGRSSNIVIIFLQVYLYIYKMYNEAEQGLSYYITGSGFIVDGSDLRFSIIAD